MINNAETLLTFIFVTTAVPAVFVWLNHVAVTERVILALGQIDGRYLPAVFLIFGLNLAFLANDVWGAQDHARAAVSSEADGLRTIARIASGVKAPIGREIIEALNRYEHYTIEEDWPVLGQSGRAYGEAGGLGAVTVLISSSALGATVLPAVQSQLLSQVSDLRNSRNMRYELAEGAINPVKWYFTFFIDLVALLTVGLGHVGNKRGQVLAFILFWAVSTPTLSLLVIESNPFAGLNSVSAAPIAFALDHSTKLLAEPKLAAGTPP